MTLVSNITFTFLMLLPAQEQVGIKEGLTEKQCYETAAKATIVAQKNRIPMRWRCFRSDDPELAKILKQIKLNQQKKNGIEASI